MSFSVFFFPSARCEGFFVSEKSFMGTHATGLYSFKHQGLKHFSFSVGGKKFPPPEGYGFNFQTPLTVAEAYSTFLENFRSSPQIRNGSLDLEEWRTNSFSLAVDLTPSLNAGSSYTEKATHTPMGFQMEFQNPLEENIIMLQFAEFDSVIQVNSSGGVNLKEAL